MSTKNFFGEKKAACLAALFILLGVECFATSQARTLSFATPHPPSGDHVNNTWKWWADQIEDRTDGSLEIKFYYMGSLVKLKDAARAVSSGIADIAFMSTGYDSDKLPLWYLANTTTGPGDQYVVSEAFFRIRKHFQPLKDEEKKNNMKFIANPGNGPQVFLSKTRPYLTPKDFKGDKVRMPGPMAKVANLAHWNVDPVALYFGQIYSAMARGTIDGAMTYVHLIGPMSQNEVGKYVVNPHLGQNTNVVMMNLDTWNGLTHEQQKVINSLQHDLLVRLGHAELEDDAEARKELQSDPKNPLIFRDITAQQRQEWAEGMRLGDKQMVEKMSQRNDHAAELQKEYRAEIKKVEQEVKKNGYPWDRH